MRPVGLGRQSMGRRMPTFADLVGQRFGQLVVLRRGPNTRQGSARWVGQCACGKETLTQTGLLQRGKVTSCIGCARRCDFSGQRFGQLVVLRPAAPNSLGKSRYVCRCDCGKDVIVSGNYLQQGDTQSCGCTRQVQGGVPGDVWRSTLGRTWHNMMRRCYDSTNPGYAAYGGRGICVCDRWHRLTSFYDDILGSLGPRPEGMTLDRIDNDGHYEPGNVRWATRQQQNLNTRRQRYSTLDGERIGIGQMAAFLAVSTWTLSKWLSEA